MGNIIPKTKEECFAQLDAMLSEEDKDVLKNSEDIFSYHFSLGMWIRNNWIYPMSDEEMRLFMRLFVEKDDNLPYGFKSIQPDSMSFVIIDKYVEYLKNIKTK